jgi:hypothetical protein
MRRAAVSIRGLLIVAVILTAILDPNWLFGADGDLIGNGSEQTPVFEAVSGNILMVPEPDPPKIDLEPEPKVPQRSMVAKDAALVEWAYHKTTDNTHPDGNEQQLLWLMNRARSNPAAEGVWLATVSDPNIASARSYFGVDLQVLQNEFAGYDAKPPAAFDVRLYDAAKAHSDDLIVRDAQDHSGQFDRIDTAGFSYSSARGCVFSYSKSALYGHAGFNIDWGYGDSTGMQPGRGHRMAIMSVDGDYSNVGLAAVSESSPSTRVGPLVVTGNYCKARTSTANHFNRFLVGTVWTDSNDNGLYDPGEGFGNVTVMPDSGNYYAVTSNSGGYAIPLTSAGEYQIIFSGSYLSGVVVKTITVGQESVLLDYLYEPSADRAQIEAFVTRFYEQCLGRFPDTAGLDGWVSDLLDGSRTGADVAQGFVLSPEFVNQGIQDEEYLTVLYRAFFDRAPDDGGKNSWLAQIQSGTRRTEVLEGFIFAQEFIDLCADYGIMAFNAEDLVEAFVTRFYRQCLSRDPDSAGLSGWVNGLLTGSMTGADLAHSFVFSPEFVNRGTTNEEYLRILYTAFFNRDPDSAGLNLWLDEMSRGMSREAVLNGFTGAQEFFDLCSEYGITPD